jgi:protein TonB
MAAITAKVQTLVAPVPGLSADESGRVFVSFVVGPKGSIYQIRVLKGLGDNANAAAMTAVRRLPRLIPGRQNGRPVAVSLTVPVFVK